jgi:hypothetical protein
MNDPVRKPKHYEIMPGLEAIDIIDVVLTSLDGEITPYQAYCLGNFLKYRLRAGDKDDLQQDIDKSNEYKAMLCFQDTVSCSGDCANCGECQPATPVPCSGDQKTWPEDAAGFKRAMRMSNPYPPNGC